MDKKEKQLKLEKRLKEINKQLKEEKSQSLRDYQIGDVLTIIFEDIYIVAEKIALDVFEVVNKGDSIKLKKGDLIRIKDPNSRMEVGEKLEFIIYREALQYESSPIEDIS